MVNFFGFDRDSYRAKIKKEIAWLRGRLPWPFSRKKQRKLVFLVHVPGDGPNEYTRHFFRRLITSKMRTLLAFVSFCLSTACIGLASYVLVLGLNALEFSKFVGLADGIGIIPLVATVICISSVQVVVHTVGSVQCLRAVSTTYRSEYMNKLNWMGFFSLGIYSGLLGMKLIISMTALYGFLADFIFRVNTKLVNGEFITDDVPFSCCNKQYALTCIHESMITFDTRDTPSVYYVGCSAALKKILLEDILPDIRWSAVGCLGILFILFVVFRYLATSLLVARSAGNGRATSVGYLLSWRRRGVTGLSTDELYALITRLPKGRKVNSQVTTTGASTSANSSPANVSPRLPPPMIVSYAGTRPFASGPWPAGATNPQVQYRPVSGGGWEPISPYGYGPGFGQQRTPSLPYYYPNYSYHNKNDDDVIPRGIVEASSSTSDEEELLNNSNINEQGTSLSESDETKVQRYPYFAVSVSSSFEDASSSSSSDNVDVVDEEAPVYWTDTGLRSPIPRSEYPLKRPADSKLTKKCRRLRRRAVKKYSKAQTDHLVRRSTLDVDLDNAPWLAPFKAPEQHDVVVRHSINIVGEMDNTWRPPSRHQPQRSPGSHWGITSELVSEPSGRQNGVVSMAFSQSSPSERRINGTTSKVENWIEHNQDFFISPVVHQFVNKSLSHVCNDNAKLTEPLLQHPEMFTSAYVRREKTTSASSDQEQPLLSMCGDEYDVLFST